MRTLTGLPLRRICAEFARLRDFFAAHRGLDVIHQLDERLSRSLSSSGTHSCSPFATESKESSIFAVKS